MSIRSLFCVGFDLVDPLTKIAPSFPDQQFAIIDGKSTPPTWSIIPVKRKKALSGRSACRPDEKGRGFL